MKKLFLIASLFVLLFTANIALAQDSNAIHGAVYVDVNGDGKCVGTGIAGEVGVANVPLQLTNSDGGIVMNHTTGNDGTFGLVSIGQSYWSVTVQPGNDWKVTSAATLFALIDDNNTTAENINFCIQATKQTTQAALLPQAGGSVSAGLTAVVALTALLLITLGLFIETRRRRA